MALLSIITPYKNARIFLVDSVQSVLNQIFTDWEWILVNDGSTDESYSILEEFAQADTRFILLNNPKKGILPALKFGLAHCKGTFITRMDADDVMPPERLQVMTNAFREAPPKTVVTGKIKYISNKPISQGYLKYERWLNKRIEQADHWKHIYRECVIASPNWMMRISELRAIDGFDDLEYPEDYALCFKWYSNNFRVIGLSETTLHWREHEKRTSRQSEHYQQPAFFKLKLKRFLELDYQKSKPLILMGEGAKAKLTASFLEEQNITFLKMVQRKKYENSFNVLHTEDLAKHTNAQILISIYPDKVKRKTLETWLYGFDFKLGENYWYL